MNMEQRSPWQALVCIEVQSQAFEEKVPQQPADVEKMQPITGNFDFGNLHVICLDDSIPMAEKDTGRTASNDQSRRDAYCLMVLGTV